MLKNNVLASLCLMFLCAFSFVTAAKEGVSEKPENKPPIIVILGKIRDLRSELVELNETSAKAEGEALDSLLIQRMDKNKKLVSELRELNALTKHYVDGGGNLEELLGEHRAEILKAGASLRTNIDHYFRQLDVNGAGRDTLTQAGLKSYKSDNLQLNAGIALLHEYIEIVKAMGFDFTSSLNYIVDVLPKRLEYLAGGVRLSAEREIELKKSIDTAEDKNEIQKKLLLVKEKLDFDSQNLRDIVAIGGSYEIDVNQYQTLLVKSTGEINSDMLDVDVMEVLIRDWWIETKHTLRNNAVSYLFKVIVFFFIILIFKIISSLVSRLIKRSVHSRKVNLSVLMQNMLISLTSRFILILGVLVALSQFGVSLGPVLAGLGVAGFVLGFALQDTLGNFAAGMMILVYRPYDVGDVVEAAGAFGTVQSMSIVSTTILTFDNQTLIIPNSKIWGDVIKNVTAQQTRRVDMTFGIGYGDEIPKAEKILHDIVNAHEKVLSEPTPVIKLHNLGDSSVDFIVRPWTKTADYWEVYWDITREVKMRFDAEGVSIPFPQRDVHVYNT